MRINKNDGDILTKVDFYKCVMKNYIKLEYMTKILQCHMGAKDYRRESVFFSSLFTKD